MRQLIVIIVLCLFGVGAAEAANECSKVKPTEKRLACLEDKIDKLKSALSSVKLETNSSGRVLCLYGSNFGVALQECNQSNNQWKVLGPGIQ